jgi:uncharacterized protein
MTLNEQTVLSYLDGFRRSDHEQILACLTDDVEWELPGIYHVRGKEAFDSHIEDEGFEGPPGITLRRLTEGGDVIVAEGTVKARRSDGNALNLVFCDVFEMKAGRISRLVSYLMEVP